MKYWTHILLVLLSFVATNAYATRSSDACEDALVSRRQSNKLASMISRAVLLTRQQEAEIVTQLLERRYEIIAEQLDENDHLQFLELPEDLKQQLGLLSQSYLAGTASVINRYSYIELVLPPQDFLTEAYFSLLLTLRYYDQDKPDRASFFGLYIYNLRRNLSRFARVNRSQTMLGNMGAVALRGRRPNAPHREIKVQILSHLYQTQTILDETVDSDDTEDATTRIETMTSEMNISALDLSADAQILRRILPRLPEMIERANLPPRERLALELRFGTEESLSLSEIALQLGGVSKQRVDQILQNALKRIRNEFIAAGFTTFME